MAQRVQVVLVDDIDGTEASETVSFELDGVAYEIDLAEGHAAELRGAFGPWVAAARRVGGRKASARKAGGARGDSDAAKIREWARSAGLEVSERGRVSQEIRAAYAAAH